jgi:hypothetical protein
VTMFSREIIVSTLLEEATVGNDRSQRIKDGDNSINSFPLPVSRNFKRGNFKRGKWNTIFVAEGCTQRCRRQPSF